MYARAVEVAARIVRLPLAETFVIAREASDYADVVHVSVTHEGVTGYGEAAPIERYDESAESAIRFVDDYGALAMLCEQRRTRRRPVLPLVLAPHVVDRDVIPHDLGGYDDDGQ